MHLDLAGAPTQRPVDAAERSSFWRDALRRRMLATADRLNREGGYLVLFETDSIRMLATGGPVPESVPADTPVFDYLGLEQAIQGRLTGRVVTCGSFVGKYAP